MAVITRRRPGIPSDYGISSETDGMLDWDDVAETLAAAQIYWVSTTRSDGSPHLIPIWGAWVGQNGYIEGGDMTLWARNLAARPAAHVGVDHGGRQVMVRGRGVKTEVDDATQTSIADVYGGKYDYRPESSTFYEMAPRTVLAWDVSTIDSFVVTPTEFVFEEAS